MKLKPFRGYDEAEVVNLYSLTENSGNAGDAVELVSWNPSDDEGYGVNLSPYAGMQIPRYERKSKVKLATRGNERKVLGIMLWNVRETDDLGRKLIYDPQRYNELQTVTSGQSVPVLVRGYVMASGFTGPSPSPGSGVGVDQLGQWTVTGLNVTNVIGTFLSSTGSDGYAAAFINALTAK